MKLRNKKTGGLANILDDDQDFIRVYTDAGWHDYDSLAELNEDWEDYKPLIDNEEIREIIRAWAKVNDATELKYYEGENCLEDIFRNEIHFNQALGLEDGNSYTIAELCEEWEDYKPKEPLIKDEKVRKAVRAWAEACGADDADIVRHYGAERWIGLRYENPNTGWVSRFEIDGFGSDNRLDHGKVYTITELCGEEEE